MKKISITILLLLGFTFLSKAQTDTTLENEIEKKTNVNAYCVIQSSNSKEIIVKDLLIGSDESDQKLLVTKEDIRKYYPNLKADFILIAKLKPEVKLLNLNELLNKYKIDKIYRNFTIAKDGFEVGDPTTLLASPNYVTNVIVNKEKQFINIITKDHEKMIEYRRRARKSKAQLQKQIRQSDPTDRSGKPGSILN